MRTTPLLLIVCLLGCQDPDGDDTGPEGDADTDADADGDADGDADADTDLCATPTVTFEEATGAVHDMTAMFLSGDYVTLAVPGSLQVCPGTWFSRVLVRADTAVLGLGATPADTILSGGEAGTIMDVAGPNVTLTVQNVTLDRGAALDKAHNTGGAGIYCEQDGVVTVTDAVFSNHVANDGPAMFTEGCTVDVVNAEIYGNVSDDDGGAVTLWDSTGSFENVDVHDNRGLDGGGMAIFNSDVTASDLTIADNVAEGFGGGIWLYNSTLALSDGVISGNTDSGGVYAGGLLVYGSAVLTRVSFTGNSAPLGGGLFVYYEGFVEGTACDFSDNSPEDVFASDGTPEGGTAYDLGSDVSFTCQDNRCQVD